VQEHLRPTVQAAKTNGEFIYGNDEDPLLASFRSATIVTRFAQTEVHERRIHPSCSWPFIHSSWQSIAEYRRALDKAILRYLISGRTHPEKPWQVCNSTSNQCTYSLACGTTEGRNML
jgi:hypothetical protein